MATTFKIISHKVGEGGLTTGLEVRRIQQLLKLNKCDVRCDGVWDPKTRAALLAFQESLQQREVSMLLFAEDLATRVRPFLLPNDRTVFELAYGAGVLIRVSVGGWLRGERAFRGVHDWCVERKAKFDWYRAVWGLDGYDTWAVVTTFAGSGDSRQYFDPEVPLALNCSLYANLMMAIWAGCNLHSPPFNPSIQQAGRSHLAVTRYGYPHAVECANLEEIQAAAKKPGRLYCLESGVQIGHMALLLGGIVYECNLIPINDSYVTAWPLKTWYNMHTRTIWVSGPSPTA